MKKLIISIILLFFANSCESLKKGLGLEKDPPDEFLVIKNKPIQAPPDFDLLPPGSKQVEIKKDQINNAKNIVDKNLVSDQKTNDDKVEQSQGADVIEREILKEIGN